MSSGESERTADQCCYVHTRALHRIYLHIYIYIYKYIQICTLYPADTGAACIIFEKSGASELTCTPDFTYSANNFRLARSALLAYSSSLGAGLHGRSKKTLGGVQRTICRVEYILYILYILI